jgi:hypothetical protein
MTSKHRKTLKEIFHDLVKSSIVWDDIEVMLMALGAQRFEGNGSRVRIFLNGIKAVFHRPHPQKETDKGAVKSVRRFLQEGGIRP